MLNGVPGFSTKKSNHGWKGWMAGGFIVIALFLPGVFWLRNSLSETTRGP